MNERRALIVGGSSGIGAACVEALATGGWSVLVADLKAPRNRTSISGFEQLDVRDADRVDAAVDLLAAGRPIHALVYAAGVGHVAPFAEISPARWRLILDVNLTGAFHVASAVLRRMPNGSSMVFISSIDSERPVPGLAHYCAAKAGLEALNRSIALEFGPRNIRSNVVAPGLVRTPLMAGVLQNPSAERAFLDLTPLATIAEPSQIAAAVAFLVSTDADHITGIRLAVDGGMSLREHPSLVDANERTP